MATYYVNGNTGSDSAAGTSAGAPWRNLTTAHARASAGDTLLLQTSTWHQVLTITKPNLTIKAQPGHTPVIDGNYHFGLMSNNWTMPPPYAGTNPNFLPGANGMGIIRLNPGADHVTIDGLTIQNVAGQGIRGHAHYTIVRNCAIFFCAGGAVHFDHVQGGYPAEYIDGILVENNRFTCCVVNVFNPDRGGESDSVGRTVKFEDVRDGIVRNNIIAFGYGEGCDLGKGNLRAICEENLFLNHRHVSAYSMYSRDNVIRRNAVVWVDNVTGWNDQITHNGVASVGIMLRDEDTNKPYPLSEGLSIYDNIVVGHQKGIWIVGGGGVQSMTECERIYIGYNTVIGGHYSVAAALQLNDAADVGNFNEGLVENNIFDNSHGSGPVGVERIGPYWRLRNNLWHELPPAKMRGANDQVGVPQLRNPYKPILGTLPTNPHTPETLCNFNPADYEPTVSSIRVIGKAIKDGAPAFDTVPPADAGRDYYGYARGAQHDLGAIEFDGDSTPPDEVVANFIYSPVTGDAPLTVQFTDTSTESGDGNINAWEWSFGDGGTATTQNPSHVYGAGTWTPTLTVRDTVHGLVDTRVGAAVVVASADSVTANFTRTPANGNAPLVVTFTDTSTKTGVAVINSWSWDFGDGTSSSQRHPVKTYSSPGVYSPTLTVRDTERGLVDSVTKGTVTVGDPGEDAIIASFTAVPQSGVAPLAVQFTDTSATGGGAEVDTWLWEFGDGGTSAEEAPLHTFTAAGVYVPRLSVSDSSMNLTAAVEGEAIQVLVEPPEAGSDVVIRSARAALRTSNGEQTITAGGLGTLMPKSVVLVATGATADGTAADGELFSYGMATGANQQAAAALATGHGVTPTTAGRRQVNGACLLIVDVAGNEVGRATFVEWVAGGVTLDVSWAGTPVAYLVTARFGAGNRYEAWAGVAQAGGVNSTVSITAAGFKPDAARVVSTWTNLDTPGADASISLGIAHRSNVQFAVERAFPAGQAAAGGRLRMQDDRVALTRYVASGKAGVRVESWDGGGVTLRVVNDAINAPLLIMLEKFGVVKSEVRLRESGVASGAVEYALGFTPQAVEHLLAQMAGMGATNETNRAGTIGVHFADGDGEYANLVSGEVGVTPTNEQSLSDNRFVIVDDDGVVKAAGATSMQAAGYRITYGTVTTPALLLPSLSVEVGQEVDDPGSIIAEFSGTPLRGAPPLRVQFTDLSNSSEPLLTWQWEFGDDATSTEQNPAHTYDDDGVYPVSLTVTNAVSEATASKAGYVVVETQKGGVGQTVVIGPLWTRAVTESSETETHWDLEDEEAGFVDVGLHLRWLELSDDTSAPEPGGNVVRVFYDAETGTVKIVRPDGVVGTVEVTWA